MEYVTSIRIQSDGKVTQSARDMIGLCQHNLVLQVCPVTLQCADSMNQSLSWVTNSYSAI